jgi:hypothetical protein
VEKDQKSVGFAPNHRPRQGDRFGFGSTVSGDDTGIGRGVCTVIGTSQALCNIQERLAKGTLSAQGLVSLSGRANKTPFSVTGGTGALHRGQGSRRRRGHRRGRAMGAADRLDAVTLA